MFVRLAAQHGHRWHSQFPTPAAQRAAEAEWAAGLKGLTGEQIRRGIQRSRTLDWPPGIAEFRRLAERVATAAELGLPDKREAYLAACSGAWGLHPAVFAAAEQVGTWELRTEMEAKTWPRWCDAWADIVSRTERGEKFELPEQVAARLSPNTADTKALPRADSRDIGRRALAEMRALLGMPPAPDDNETDPGDQGSGGGV